MDNRVFEPEVVLEHEERGQVAQTVATPGFRIIHSRIMRSAVDQFLLELINVKPGAEDEVIARHQMAKAAAVFYQIVIDRVNREVEMYMAASATQGKPVDPTETLLDLGMSSSQISGTDFDALEEGTDDEY